MSDRIALVSGSAPPIKCGVGDFNRRLARELVRQGHLVTIITDRRANPGAPDGVQIMPVVDSWTPLGLNTVIDALRRLDPCVVNIQYPTQQYGRVSLIDLLPWAIRAILHVPVITTVHEFTTYQRAGKLRVANLVRSSTAAIVPDPVNRDALAQFMPSIASRLISVPLGPSIEPDLPGDFDPLAWRAAHGVDENTVALVYFGFISPSKGVDVLLRALERLPGTFSFQLWLLADREPSSPQYAGYHRAISAQLKQSPRAAQISWTGYLPGAELSQYLAAGDLAVLPFSDGASMRRTTMLAALAHGLPVLSTGMTPPCAGVTVVQTGNADALAREIVRLGRDRVARSQLAAEAREMALNMSWPAIAEQTAAQFDIFCKRMQ